MSVLSEAKNFLALIKAPNRDWLAIVASGRSLLNLLIGTGVDIPVFGKSEGGEPEGTPADLKACLKEISDIVPSLDPPVSSSDEVGKLGDGHFIELLKLILPLIIKFLPLVI